ncbi:FAD-dependent oxidoreductase [uncultured Parasutterella sp.]|uniref:FAD-dependent oxidoreductase n=1 Tax=uncultured Parasutterella sp. TaxID=1263098 RepID=UPI00272BD930|nr:FAD-dependent oxidoreductase [uncultured Parasutterella sp.]
MNTVKTAGMIALSLYLSAMVCSAEHELTTDILVVGGSAGLSAAVQGAESGKKVILLEKNGIVGGSSAFLPKDCSRLTCSIGSK